MFYISNLKGLQLPFKPGKIKDKSVSQTQAISRVESKELVNDLKEDSKPKNLYEKQLKKERIKRKLPKLAEDIMSSPVFTINQNKKTKVASEVFLEKRYRHIPVVDDSSILVGILSDRDLFNIKEELQVKDAMSKDIITARPDASIRSISQVLIEERIGCIPIVSSENELLGIITRTDILRSLVRDAPLDLVF